MTAELHSNVGGADMPTDHWVGAMGLVLSLEEGGTRGQATLLPSMWGRGTRRPRMAILATLVDVIGGHVPDGPRTPTIDLRVQATGEVPETGPIELVGRAKKVGSRLIVAETTILDADGRVFALGTTQFMNQLVVHSELGLDGVLRPVAAIDSFDDLIDATVVDDHTLELHPRDQLSNGPYGTVQGGVQAALAELSAEQLLGPGSRVVDLDIRYLNRVKVGPLRAAASLVGRTGPLSSVRVTLSDHGDGDRPIAYVSILATTDT